MWRVTVYGGRLLSSSWMMPPATFDDEEREARGATTAKPPIAGQIKAASDQQYD